MAQKRKSGNKGAKKRSSSSAKKGVSAAARGRAAAEEKARIRLEITSIVLIAFGAFLIFALFSNASGVVGAGLDSGLSGLFGPMDGALPFFLIAYGVLLIIGMLRGVDLKRSILIAAVFILFCILLAGRYIEVVDGETMITGGGGLPYVFSQSAAGDGGGVIGTYLAKGLVTLIGKPGLYILCIALVCISGILLAGMSISMATRVVREKTLSRREEREKRMEERRMLYEEESDGFDDAEAMPRTDGYKHGSIRIPSFLSGTNNVTDGADKQQSIQDTDKQQRILDAVKNDELYGDVPKERSLEIEDASEPRAAAVKPAETHPVKRSSDEMHYSPFQDDSNYKLPTVALLPMGKGKATAENPAVLQANAAKLERALHDFKIEAHVVRVTVGPTVTRYEVEPDIGVKIQSIRSLEPDLALKLEVRSVRVVPMSGKSLVGIEAYNANTSIVSLRDIIDSDEFNSAHSKISLALGKNIAGKRIIVDLAEMPHLLIAGMTGAGKSVCINSILLSILYKAKPSEVKMILIDPKVVELNSYNDLPHLLVPVVTDPERAATALSYAVRNMEDRYKKFAENQVNNLSNFNAKMRKEGRYDEVLPQVVIVIDELADLMMAARDKVETSIARLAQKARAAGMHLIVATQQPLVTYLTSIIKANIPARIAFAVTSNSASRVILDTPGAELLTGRGDMLFAPRGPQELIRVQGAFTEESDVIKVVNYIKKQMEPDYSVEVMTQVNMAVNGSPADGEDEFFLEAVEMLSQSKTEPKQISVSMLQRRFRIGYNRAARLVDLMEERGIVSGSDGTNKPRRLIMSEAQLQEYIASAGQSAGGETAVSFDMGSSIPEPYEDEEEDGDGEDE